MFAGRQYTLQCTVQNVAPVENLNVTFYRGETELGKSQSKDNKEKNPVTEIFTLSFSPSEEDDGVQYWCEAKLEFGLEGPQPPPMVTSQNITATVYCECDYKEKHKTKVNKGTNKNPPKSQTSPFMTILLTYAFSSVHLFASCFDGMCCISVSSLSSPINI